MRFKPKMWTWIVGLAWLAFIIPTIIPGTFWYKMHSLHVEDATFKKPPVMKIDRTIYQPFSGVWLSTVYKSRGDDEFELITGCTKEVPLSLSRDLKIPDNLTLLGAISDKCDLRPGMYQVRALLVIDPKWFPTKRLIYKSNVFTIYPEDQKDAE